MEFIVYQDDASHKLTAIPFDKNIHQYNLFEASEFFFMKVEARHEHEAIMTGLNQGFAETLNDMMQLTFDLIGRVKCTTEKEWLNCVQHQLQIATNQQTLKPYLNSNPVVA